MGFLFVLIVGLLAGTISGIVGTGSSIMLMPVLVYQYGPKQAVPIMAVAAVMANLSRILAWWREVDWRACAAYSVTGIPAAALGARTLLVLPSHAVDIAIGVFLIFFVRNPDKPAPMVKRAEVAKPTAPAVKATKPARVKATPKKTTVAAPAPKAAAPAASSSEANLERDLRAIAVELGLTRAERILAEFRARIASL